MRLNKVTGRRIPRANAQEAVLTYSDESLRLITDEEFAAAQRKLESRARRGSSSRPVEKTRALTGHLYCAVCGSRLYSRKSKNAKGEYHDWNCGRRQRLGPQACLNTTALREDQTMDQILGGFSEVFDDADRLIQAAIKEAETMMGSSRDRVRQLKQELTAADRRAESLTNLLVDPEITPGAKPAISRQLADLEIQRESIRGQLDLRAEETEAGLEKMIRAIRKAFTEAKEHFANLATPAQLNDFVGRFVGRVEVGGSVRQVAHFD